MIAKIPVGNQFALVSKVDQEFLLMFNWSLSSDGYAQASVFGKTRTMHQLVLGRKIGKIKGQTDHRNRIKLDNRRSNLRDLTLAKNNQNKLGKGVYKTTNGWTAQITINSRVAHLGEYPTYEWARKAYLQAKEIHHGVTLPSR